MPQRDWVIAAACRDEDPELFFPTAEPGTTAYQQQTLAAIAVCKRCPVIDQCRKERGPRNEYGIFAGLPEDQVRNYNRTTIAA